MGLLIPEVLQTLKQFICDNHSLNVAGAQICLAAVISA